MVFTKLLQGAKAIGRRVLSTTGETVRRFGDLVGRASGYANAISPHVSAIAGLVSSSTTNPVVKSMASKIAYGTGLLGSAGGKVGYMLSEGGKYLKSVGDGTPYTLTPLTHPEYMSKFSAPSFSPL